MRFKVIANGFLLGDLGPGDCEDRLSAKVAAASKRDGRMPVLEGKPAVMRL
jgi:hypothetical protein